MLRRDAFKFSKSVSDLWAMQDICQWSAINQLDSGQVSDTRVKISDVAEELAEICVAAGLTSRLESALSRFRSSIGNDDLAEVGRNCMNIRDRLIDELEHVFYLRISSKDQKHFSDDAPFGERVKKKFPKSASDFCEAAKCLSVQQPTACIFHLMRGVEAAVHRLASKLSISIDSGATWRQVTNAMVPSIAAMPNQSDNEKRKREFWEDARMNLDVLGKVVRNKTMHAASSYTQEDARHIFNLANGLMNVLCKL